ncbi:MAG TPA: response regulator [Saprospiraceae bacterium]|nr:response regulator [Saprospiraceae bacterium]HNT19557.1 response regulator [Saprospiraceae bacterium]
MQNLPISVLLADDDEDDRILFQEALNEIKFKTEVRTVGDGRSLMEYLNRPEVKLPQVIFLDLNMPLKSGMECLHELKSSARFGNIAVAIYSTSASEEDIEETFVRGANVYIRKPDDFNELKRILEKVITINWQYHTSGLNRENFLLSF